MSTAHERILTGKSKSVRRHIEKGHGKSHMIHEGKFRGVSNYSADIKHPERLYYSKYFKK